MLLDKYIWKQLLRVTSLILLVLLIIFLASSLGELIYNFNLHDLPMHYLPKILLAQMPELFLLLVGISLYMGIIVTLNSLNSSSEAVVMLAIGLSKGWMVRCVLIYLLPFLILIGVVSFFLMPMGFEQTRLLSHQASQEVNLKFSKQSLHTFGDSVMMYVNNLADNDQIENLVLHYETDESLMLTAKKGVEYEVSGLPWLSLFDVLIYSNQGSTTSVSHFKKLDFSLQSLLKTSDLGLFKRSIRMFSVSELIALGNDEARSEFYWRLSFVMSTLLFCLLAVFLVRYQPRKGSFSNIFPALLVFLLYSRLLTMVRQNTEDGSWSPELGYLGVFSVFAVTLVVLWLRSENHLDWKRWFSSK